MDFLHFAVRVTSSQACRSILHCRHNSPQTVAGLTGVSGALALHHLHGVLIALFMKVTMRL